MMARRQKQDDITVAEIAIRLGDHAEAVCKALGVPGKPAGGRWMCASGFAAVGTQVSIKLTNDKAGRWRDFAADFGGDMLDLVQAVRGGGKKEAVDWAKSFLGIGPDVAAKIKTGRPAARENRRHDDRQAADIKRRKAYDIWLDGVVGDGTGVEGYLYSRGIDVAALGGVPRAVRFAPLLQRWQPEFEIVPHMIAAVTDGDGRFMTVHGTPITAPGVRGLCRRGILNLGARGGWTAMTFTPKKLVRGPYTGGVIRLTDARPTLAVAEGIETALAVAVAHPRWAVAAAVSVGNMASVPVPPITRRLVLIGDGDSSPRRDRDGAVVRREDGSPVIPADDAIRRAGQIHARRARFENHQLIVEIKFAPPGLDFADLAQQERVSS